VQPLLSNSRTQKNFERDTESSSAKKKINRDNATYGVSFVAELLGYNSPKSKRSPSSSAERISNKLYNQPTLSLIASRVEFPPMHPFKPELNPHSKELAKKKKIENRDYLLQYSSARDLSEKPSESKRHVPQWELLYSLDVQRRRLRDEVRREISQKREEDELRACTFRPQLNTTTDFSDSRSVIERNEAWLFSKQKKLERQRKKEAKDEVKDCSFQPNLRSSQSSYSQLNLSHVKHTTDPKRGVDKFLLRFELAQERKREEAEAFLLPSQRKQQQQSRSPQRKKKSAKKPKKSRQQFLTLIRA